MSRKPIARSSDLTRLQNEGYDLDVRGGHLLVQDVPFVKSDRTVGRGALVMALDLRGDVTAKPSSHVAYWVGEHPCNADGRRIETIANSSNRQTLHPEIIVDHMFSAKADYRDFHHKVTTYVACIAGEAGRIDPVATACTFPVIVNEDEDSPFLYADTATSRAGIGAINARVRGQKVGIVGLGGTGCYVFDLVAKTEVAEIRAIDGDDFQNHNAFRSAGAASIDELRARLKKVRYFGEIYGRMRRGIVEHSVYLDAGNLDLLDGLDFVFICIDEGEPKKLVVEKLIANETAFVDVGLGVQLQDDHLGGLVRVTASTPATRDAANAHIPFSDGEAADAYATNIQTAELNMLNAALAVLQWKRMAGIYRYSRNTVSTTYVIASGEVANDEAA
jgi:hypothetical protein